MIQWSIDLLEKRTGGFARSYMYRCMRKRTRGNAMMDQIDMFSFLKSQESVFEPPILLKAGQEVFLVVKGDVEPYIVLDETWTCGENNDEGGYRLQRPNNGAYNAIWNSSVGSSCFLDFESARKAAETYLIERDVIKSENIKPIKTVAYSYIRKCDNREMIAFYSELDNGMVYIKEFMTYQHIVDDKKKAKAIKRFMEQREFKQYDVKQIGYDPAYKNMYRIKQEYDWDYAEAGHSYAVG